MDPEQHRDDKEAWKEQNQCSRAKARVVNAPLAKLIEQNLVLASKNLDFFVWRDWFKGDLLSVKN